jgi:hypothetical protein
MDPFLDLDELYDVHRRKDMNKIKVYKQVYQKCLDRISYFNNNLHAKSCDFEVPTWVWGVPIYDYEDLKTYILFKLNENGLPHCYYVTPTTLFIQWGPGHVDKRKYQDAKKKYIEVSTLIGPEQPVENKLIGFETTSNGNIGGNRDAGPVRDVGTQRNVHNNGGGPNSSGMMRFDSTYEIPVNMDKIRTAKRIALAQQERKNPPNRQLVDSWKKYFDKFKES